MRVLVTGRNGQVSQSLVELSTPDETFMGVGRPELDITDRASIARVIERLRPDIVVNAAAYTAVDKAESDAAAAMAANCEGARNVAIEAANAGLPIIQISTDYVFSGDKRSIYAETDEAGPINVYGRSKLAGERAVADANPASAILRTAWVHSPFGSNFVKTMLRLAADRDTVRVVADQHGTPTYAADIAVGVREVARRAVLGPNSGEWRGTFHMVSESATTWAGFAEAIFAASAKLGGPSASVEPIATTEYPLPAARPRFTELDTRKFRQTFKHILPHWEAGARACVGRLVT